ncbi:MAG: sulfurtransferase [Ilumatobacteraceae bacterium]
MPDGSLAADITWQAAVMPIAAPDNVRDAVPPIVDAAWLRAHETAVLCDVRSTMTSSTPDDDFAAAHLPGAVLVLLDDVLAGPPAGVEGRHPLPHPDAFAASMGALGIGHDDLVVAYDDRGGAFASRLVWMLRIIGQRAALLDGGLRAWDGPTATGPAERATVQRPPTPWPAGSVADADEVVAHVEHGGVVVDSRDAARYAGETEPIDAVAGHVPGAVNVPFPLNLDAGGSFHSPEELAGRFRADGVDGEAIVYCGSGVTACHNALAIERAGFGLPRVYVGSWSGWSSDTDRPVATGPE